MSSARPSLAIVIHTEEEFDWNGGFYRSNNQVTHGKELTSLCERFIAMDAPVTFALDYAFVDSEEGKKVIEHFNANHQGKVEFATHLHPWVSPPFDGDESEKGEVSNFKSYPGNLSKELEYQKLSALTDKITHVSGQKPTTYLAGRYGIGKNTHETLLGLGYQLDVSISPFTNFSHQQGPDFSHCNNDVSTTDGLCYIPHTTAVLSRIPLVANLFNNNPHWFEKGLQSPLTRLLMKVARVKKQRLSPEGFALNDMKRVIRNQLKLGQQSFVFSFHSPSVKVGLTPYTQTAEALSQFEHDTLALLSWFKEECQGKIALAKDIRV